jgi:energy-coupling factor transport system substrate-specific component
MAKQSGFSDATLDMEYRMVMTPHLMIVGILITAALAVLGTLFGQRLLRKHFEKAGIIK